jgi:hypothetical protein
MKTAAVIAFVLIAACVPDPHVGHICTNAFMGEDVFVVRTSPVTYSRVGVRMKDGSTLWMARNELANCRRVTVPQ